MRHAVVIGVVVLVLAAGCGDDTDPTAATSTTVPPTTVSSTTSTAETTTSTEATTTTESTPPPTSTTEAPDCDPSDVVALADTALTDARLAPDDAWTDDTAGNPFVERTRPADWMPTHLGFACGVLLAQSTDDGADRLLLAAWTGPRIAYVVQASDAPATPFASEAVLFLVSEEPRGEWLDDERSVWAGTLAGGETLIVGHVDHSLGVVAKEGWQVGVEPLPNAESTLDSERHALAVLEAAGMHGPAVAQSAEFQSEEGTVMFVSAAVQISVVDVAPAGWFDPLVPRYHTGTTTRLEIDGVTVRRTDAGADDQHTRAAELGWACGEWVWILEPPFNGTADEMVDVAAAIIAADDC